MWPFQEFFSMPICWIIFALPWKWCKPSSSKASNLDVFGSLWTARKILHLLMLLNAVSRSSWIVSAPLTWRILQLKSLLIIIIIIITIVGAVIIRLVPRLCPTSSCTWYWISSTSAKPICRYSSSLGFFPRSQVACGARVNALSYRTTSSPPYLDRSVSFEVCYSHLRNNNISSISSALIGSESSVNSVCLHHLLTSFVPSSGQPLTSAERSQIETLGCGSYNPTNCITELTPSINSLLLVYLH